MKRLAIKFLITTAMLAGCKDYKYKDDNLAEEIVEVGIGIRTGIDLDLTPKTPEQGFSPTTLKPWEKVTVEKTTIVEITPSEAATSPEGK